MNNINSDEQQQPHVPVQLPSVPADRQGAETGIETPLPSSDAGQHGDTLKTCEAASGACIMPSAEHEQTMGETTVSASEPRANAGEEAQKEPEPDKYGRGRDGLDDLPPGTPQFECKHLYPQAVDMLVESHTTLPALSQATVRRRPFKKGESGNPLGRPRGSRNRSTLAAEAMMDGRATEVLSKTIEEASKVARRFCAHCCHISCRVASARCNLKCAASRLLPMRSPRLQI
jgi:hypothetical protein